MENILNKFIPSVIEVSKRSKYVKVNYDRLDEVIKTIDKEKVFYWLDSNPFNILDLDSDLIVDILLFLHTIGDYCFWGYPKWTINVEGESLDGSYAMIYLVLKFAKDKKDFTMNEKEFDNFLLANVEIPLIKDRFKNLCDMNKFLNGRKFSDLIKGLNNDVELFNYIISNLSYFEDESIYNGAKVFFYKRAQLLVSDILHVRFIKDGIKVDYSSLVGCADYKLPQVMRSYGIIEFDPKLAKIVDNGELLQANSEMEIEIRANTIVVIDYISKELKFAKMDVNDYIWLLGQNKEKMNKPYHKTLTNKY